MTEDEPESTIDPTEEASSLLPGFLARSFLAKFLLTVILVFLVVGTVSAVTYVQTDNELTSDVREELTGVAESNAQVFENWRNTRSDTTRRLSEFGVVQTGDTEDINQFLEAEIDRLPEDVTNVHLVDLSGTSADIIASDSAANRGLPLLTREAPWQDQDLSELAPTSDDVFVSDAEEALSQSLVSFVSPVDREGADEDAQIAIVMQTSVDEVARQVSTQEDQFTQVVDSRQRVVADTALGTTLDRNRGSLGSYIQDEERATEAQSFIDRALTERGFTSNPIINEELEQDHVVAYAPIEGSDLAAITHVQSSSAFSVRSTVLQSLLILTAVVFVGFGLIVLIFGRGAVLSLNRLTEKAQELESGNLDVELPVTRTDEFGQLTATFASMRDTVRQRIDEANEARQEAEQARVEAVEMNNYLQDRAEDYGEIMQKSAQGDMTQRMDQDGENEAMDLIAQEFNDMLNELEKTTGQLQTFSGEVIDSSDIVKTSAESVREASEEVAESAQRISDDAHEQRDRLSKVATDLDDAIETFERIAEQNPEVDIDAELTQFRELQQLLEDATDTSDGMLPETENVAGAAEEQAAELNEVTSRADRLKRYAKPLGDIVNKFETDDEHEFVFSTGPTEAPNEE